MGVVYRGFDEALLRPVALKRLLPDRADATTRKRFRREAQAASRLNHPSIVHIYDIVETPDGDWIVMELVEGRPLDDLTGELDVPQALRIAREVAEGLAEAHGIGVIHRDLKTSNVMVTKSGRAKILDFGIAKVAQGSDDTVLSQVGTIIGTFHAMSPEQAMGRPIDPRSDLFSLGTLLYELLTGTSPFRGNNSTETLARVCSYRQPPVHRLRREIPQEVSELVDHLLQKDPDLRPHSAQDVVAALDRAMLGVSSGLSSPSRDSSLPTWIAPPTFINPPTLEQTLREGYLPKSVPQSVPQNRPPSVSESRRTVRERRQVTVACCELTAFREAGGRVAPTVVDPEALAEILPEIKAMAGRVTERFSGQVGDSLGRRMVLCFGYPQAHEDAAARGVRAALDFVAEVERLSSRFDTGGEIRLALRAGVHTGTAIVLPDPEPPSLGATLDTASGLLLHAAPGEVLVSTATHRLLRDAFTTERRPTVEVQGTGEVVDAFRVLEAAGPPEPAVAAGPLVGRERELELLADLWRKAADGIGQVALITGEAGLGKSRLIQALRERVDQDAARWLYAYGSPHDQSSPLQPVVNVLRRLADSQEAETPLGRIEALLRACSLPSSESVPLFAALLGVPLEEPYRLPPLGPDRLREKTLEAVAALTLEMAERQPLVWVIEDLHWLDPTTLRWLDLLLEQASSVPLFLVLTVRPQTLEAVWSPKGHVTQISLTPLAQSDVERLIERLMEGKQELSGALRREIVARTDGVPLFVEELTKTVLESGRTGGRPDIPSTLRDSLATRLDRLGDAKGVAQVASVIGRSFSLELLTAVSSLDETALQRELRRLVQAELVFRRGFGSRTSYLFKHALIRDAAYDSLLTRERQQLHLRVAQALETPGTDREPARPEILAYHYTEGSLPEKAVAHWLEAARQALGRSAHLEALHHVREGLAVIAGGAGLPPGPARDEIELQLQTTLAPAVIATQGFSSPEVERAYLRGLELCGEQQGRFELLYGLFSFYAVQAKPDRALPLAEQMLQLAESQESAVYRVQSRYGLGAMSFLLGDFPASRRHLAAALAEDDPELGRLLPLSFGSDDRKACMVYDALDLWLLGRPDQALERCRAALAWTRETSQPFTLTTVLLLSGFLHRFRRDDSAVRRHAEEMIALCQEHGLFQVRDANVLLGLALSSGDQDADAGIDHLKASLEAYRATGFRVFLSFYLAELSAACLRRGRLEESEAALQEAFGAVHGGSERFWEPELHRLRGELLALSGSPQEAEASFRKALATAAGRSALALELRAAVSLARLWQGQGQKDEARQLLSSVYARFGEGLETAAELTEAGALLTALA